MFVVLSLALTGCSLTDPAVPTVPAIAPPVPGQPQSVVPVVPLEPRLASGTRLEAIAWEAPGDVLAFQTFWDTELDVGCDFHEAEDGSHRCFPNLAATDLVYLDAACTEPALGMRYAAPRAYESVWVSTDGRCGTGHVMAVEPGEAIPSSPSTPLFVSFGHGCEALSGYTSTVPDGLYAFEPVPLASLVRADRYPAIAGDAYASVLVADDGARHARTPGLSDGEFCWTVSTSVGERCQPFSGAVRNGEEAFADAACSQPVATMATPACDAEWAIDSTGGDRVLRPVLDAWEGDIYVSGAGQTCVEDNGFEPDRTPVRVGDPVPTTDWPEMARTTRGTAALNQPWMTSADGVAIAVDQSQGNYLGSLFIDGVPCTLASLGGDTVCIPEPSEPRYADAACTVLLVGDPGEIVVDWADGTEGLDAGTLWVADAVYTAGAEYTGQVFRKDYAGSCDATSWGGYEPVPFAPVTLTRASL